MALFDKISAFAQSAVDKTNEMLETNKLSSDINNENTKISEVKKKIGEYYYAKHQAGELLDDEPTGLCLEIKACEGKIASLQAEIQAKKDEATRARSATRAPAPVPSAAAQSHVAANICPSCNAANASDTKFCKECGSKLEKVPEPIICSCGAENAAGTKFCHECGAKLEIDPMPITCSCGTENPAGTKFCCECGNKF